MLTHSLLPVVVLAATWYAALNAAITGEAQWKTLKDRVIPLMTSGTLDKAELCARQGLAQAEKTCGPAHRNTEISQGNLALVLRFQKRYEESEKH